MRSDPLAHDASAAEGVSGFEQHAGHRCAGARACSSLDVPAHEVADLDPRCGGPGSLEREGPGQVSRHVVIAERGQQYRTGSFGAWAEFLKHLADERRFAGGVQVDRACIHRRAHAAYVALNKHRAQPAADLVPSHKLDARRLQHRIARLEAAAN